VATIPVERRAFAKINLDLRVLSTRGDGYHDVATVYQSISLHDLLRFERRPPDEPLSISCDDAAVPLDGRNLVWKAAEQVWQALGRHGAPRGVHVRLAKRIPMQGGLGGGSADAAVALQALAELWEARLDAAAWPRLAARIGADVPYFLVGGTALGTGRGDALAPWPDAPPLELVLAFPPFGVPTPEAYRWYDESEPSPVHGVPHAPAAAAAWRDWLRGCRNDLEPAVSRRYDLITRIEAWLKESGALLALMSGSGSTVFGGFESPVAADEARHVLHRNGVSVVRCRTLGRAEYSSLSRAARGLPHDSAIV
jgi:4-diphosphocytidyl-2-C-methyl-D-erythritol kinase